jgi:hypothetical protein
MGAGASSATEAIGQLENLDGASKTTLEQLRDLMTKVWRWIEGGGELERKQKQAHKQTEKETKNKGRKKWEGGKEETCGRGEGGFDSVWSEVLQERRDEMWGGGGGGVAWA